MAVRDGWQAWKVAPDPKEKAAYTAFKARDRLREAMARDAARNLNSRGATPAMVNQAWAQARRDAEAAARRQRLEQAKREAELRRRREMERRRNQQTWNQIRGSEGATGILGNLLEPIENLGRGDSGQPIGPFSPENLALYEQRKNQPDRETLRARQSASLESYGKFREFETQLERNPDIFLGDARKRYDPSRPVNEQVDEVKHPAIKQYEQLVKEYLDRAGSGATLPIPGLDSDSDGELFGSFGRTTSMTGANLNTMGFDYLLAKDEKGNWIVEPIEKTYLSYAQKVADPDAAGELAYELLAAGYYGWDSADEKRLRERLQPYKKKDGTTSYRLLWNEDDWEALETALRDTSVYQLNQYRLGGGDYKGYEEMIAERAEMGLTMAEQGLGVDSGGGGYGWGGGGWGYGGGGGGGDMSVQYTDPTALTEYVNTVAQEKLGRELTAEEASQFVERFHALEREFYGNYHAKADRTNPDPTGQANAFIQELFAEEQEMQAGGEYFAALLSMMRGGGGFSMGGS